VDSQKIDEKYYRPRKLGLREELQVTRCYIERNEGTAEK
jgi:hypothetical protein